MPILLSVDSETRRVYAIAMGTMTFEDICNHLMLERKMHGLSYPEFVDARGAGIQLSPAVVRAILQILRRLALETKLGATAVVVSTDVAFGVMRMLETLTEDVCEIKPFRDEQAAQKWLDAWP